MVCHIFMLTLSESWATFNCDQTMHVKLHALDFHFEVEIFKLYLFDDVFKVNMKKDILIK